jgi:hypothetical protein
MAREYLPNPTVEIPEGVTLDKPGVYEWAITYPDGSIRRYVAKYTRRSRPMREYPANVERILNGRPIARHRETVSGMCIASWRWRPPKDVRSSSRSLRTSFPKTSTAESRR